MEEKTKAVEKMFAICAADDFGRANGVIADISYTLNERIDLLQQNNLKSTCRGISDISIFIENAKVILLLLSSNSISDVLFVNCYELCHRMNKRIIPVWIDDSEIDWKLPLRSCVCRYTNAIGRRELMDQITSLLGCISNVDDKRLFKLGTASFEMIKVKGGSFSMGAHHNTVAIKRLFLTSYEPDYTIPNYDANSEPDESPVHKVSLSEFYMGKFAVTQAIWKAVMGNNPSRFHDDDKPVDSVNKYDCELFLDKLNAMLKSQLTNESFRLPTEAEWEYAARGGINNDTWIFSGDKSIYNVVWFSQNSSTTMKVGVKAPNSLGIYDMCGNVWEICQDIYAPYENAKQINPIGVGNGKTCVRRGGAYSTDFNYCRVSARGKIGFGQSFSNTGFRLVLSSSNNKE